MADIFEEIVRLRSQGIPAALATIINTKGSTPGRETMRLLVCEDGSFVGTVGGGCLGAEVYEAAKKVIADEKTQTLSFSLNDFDSPENGLICGGQVTIFVEPLTQPTLLIFGGGHISKAICKIAAMAGFRVEIAEDRESFASKERFPEASELHVGGMAELGGSLAIGPMTYIVVVTRGHKGDGAVLAALAAREAKPRYLGMIGSKVKRGVLFKKLREEDGVGKAWLDKIKSPVGLAIGARSHEEIAVAIVAEMIQERRQG